MTQDNYSLSPGTIIQGPRRSYKIIKKLGQGGFGITYLVEGPVKVDNIVVNVRFALKEHFISSLCSRESATQQVSFSSPVAAEVQNSMRSFIKEASRLQDLNVAHRNIVKINEVFEANNTAYYVMEYLEGETLADYIEREGPLTFEQASSLLRPVAEAVAELHAQRLTHYDIKPANIILARGTDGEPSRPVLIDFGLSKHYDHEGHATSTVASGGYSPGYSPVEQYAGIKTFIPQADVYALAATLWHCLTGKAPAESVTAPVNTIDAALAGVASPGQINALRHAMAIVSEERTPDAAAFVKEVFADQAVTSQAKGTLASPPSKTSMLSVQEDDSHATTFVSPEEPSSKPWLKWAIAGAVALIGIILAVVLILPDKELTIPQESTELSGDDFKQANYTMTTEEAKESIPMPDAELYNSQPEEASGIIEATDFTLPTLNGKQVSLSDFRGKWVVLDFWASWCGWCIKGFPALKEAYAKYGDKLVIIGINCSDSEESWRATLKKYDLPWLQLYNGDSKALYEAYDIQGFPTKAIINPVGKIVDLTTGEDPAFYGRLASFLN